MAEKRKKSFAVLLKFGGKTLKAFFFNAEAFSEDPDDAGLYRIRVCGKWFSQVGARYEFFDAAGAFTALARLWFGAGEPPPPPDWPKSTRVAVLNGNDYTDLGLGRMRDVTFTSSRPFLAHDGRWKVFVVGREEPVAVDDCEAK
ncbi:MAG: hypothetical protein HQK81_06260 [Desulfovibrionaceae bacterium]|nr:hypothetical protein [Desulfovibrionaceae bacterium]MBF0513653.1 hypothetical protein [Desulfovibrionaceae bacterium]